MSLSNTEKHVKDIRRKTRCKFSSEENYYYPWELEQAIGQWVQHYNHERYHDSLDNVTPSDVYHARSEEILDQRAIIKSRTMNQRKVQNLRLAG